MKATEHDWCWEYWLSGSAKARRVQLRGIQRKHPGCRIERRGPVVTKVIDGIRTVCEDANRVQPQVIVFKPGQHEPPVPQPKQTTDVQPVKEKLPPELQYFKDFFSILGGRL